MIKELHDILHINHPELDIKMNGSQTKISIDKDYIKISQVEKLYEIKYDNYIHYTGNQAEILKIIKDNI